MIIARTCNRAVYVKPVAHLSIEKDFLDSLPLSQQCTEEEEELLHFLFENKLKKVAFIYLHFFMNCRLSLMIFVFSCCLRDQNQQ